MALKCIHQNFEFVVFYILFSQPEGKGKYVFDIGCQQHGEYIPIEQVRCGAYHAIKMKKKKH